MPERSSRSSAAVADDLNVHLTEFLATFARAGYAEKTRHDKERLIVPFIRWVRESDLAIIDVDEASINAFLACPLRRRYMHRTALQQFVEHLRVVGAVPPRCSEPSAADLLIRRYVDHLRDKQGFSVTTPSPFTRRSCAHLP